jgi:Family of unknown function (DUF5675)
MRIDLLRVGRSNRGTFGVLRYQQVAFAVTLERPWEDNQQNISSIPAGRYRCRRIRSPRFGNTYEVCDVPNRTNVLFHKGNYLSDTQGCILVGEEFSGTWDKPFVASSERGFSEFMQLLADAPEFDVVIHDPPDIRDESVDA